MAYKLIIVTLIFMNAYSFSADSRKEILRIIDEEIREVDRLSRQYRGKNPNVLFRKSELYLEKGRIVKEIENEKFLSIPYNKRKKLKKNKYFKGSYNYFLKAKNTALTLTRKFPSYKRSSDVYYILGFNEKEFGSLEKAQSYLQRSERIAKPGSKAQVRAQSALAEMYYNQKKYRKAISYYEKNLKIIKDRWWTKDAYNLSWSHFRIKNYERAIELMKKVDQLSKKPEYIDMSGQVKKDIGLFYAESGRIKEGVQFYQKYNQDYALELITIGAFLKESGKYAQALSVLTEALKISKGYKNRVKIYLARIELFDKYEKINYHLKDCIALYKITKNFSLTKDQFEIFKYQVKKQVGKIQKQIANPTYKKSKAIKDGKVKQVVSYLALLKDLEPDKKDDSNFYMAETYYQGDEYEKAIIAYQKAYKLAKERGDSKIAKLSLEGMLSAIAVPKSKFPQREKYFYPVYTTYLANDPRSQKSKEIYKRLYKIQYDNKNSVEMKKVLQKFSSTFPQDQASQEKMINSLIEVYNTQKNTGQLALLMSEISGGKYQIGKKAKDDLFSVYQKLEIKKVEENLAKGDFSSATEGYLKIYSNKQTSSTARANAAYNLMVISYKGLKLQETYSWGTKALALMKDKDFYSYRTTFLSVGKYLFDRMQFSASADISHRSLAKICKNKSKVKEKFFNNALVTYKASGNIGKISNLRKLVSSCGLSSKALVNLDSEVLDYYDRTNKMQRLSAYISRVKGNKELHPVLIELSYKIYNFYQKNLMSHQAKKWKSSIYSFYQSSKAMRKDIPVDALDVIASFELPRLESLYAQLKKTQLKFPEKVFNNILQSLVAKLDVITNEALKIQKIGSGLGIIRSFEVLVASYSHVANLVSSFSPPGKGPEYVKSFKKSMLDLTGPLTVKARDYEKEAREALEKSEILVNHNFSDKSFTYNVFDDLKFYDAERLGQ